MSNILLALSKNRISHEIQRHLREDNRSGIILEERNSVTFEKFNVIVIDDLLPEKNLILLEELSRCNKNFETIVITYARERDCIAELSRQFRIFRILPSNWTPLGVRYAIHHGISRSMVRKVALELQFINESKSAQLQLLKEELSHKLQSPTLAVEELREDIADINKKIMCAKKEIETICEGQVTLLGSINEKLNATLQKTLQISNKLSQTLSFNDPSLYDISCMEKKVVECSEIIDRLPLSALSLQPF